MPLKNNLLPKYHQINEILRERITSGELKPGDQIPTEEELCQEFDVSRGTVRRAILSLAQVGLIHSEQGRGTFVTPSVSSPLSFILDPFNSEMIRRHRQPSTRLISSEIIPASPEIAKRLELKVEEPIIQIVRLRLANDQPVIYEYRSLAQSLCPELINEDLETQSIHSLLISKFHKPLTKIALTIEAVALPEKEAQWMQVSKGTEAFFIDRLTYTIDKDGQQKPAVFYQAYYREHVYSFRAEFDAHL